MTYAKNTTVSVEKSKAEIERILVRYGARAFGYMVEPGRAVVQFQTQDRWIRFVLPMPDLDSREFTHHSQGRRTSQGQEAKYEQATRQRWRALALAIKAKLEVVESGIASFEAEFAAHILLPDGRTVGEWLLPQIEQAYTTNAMPGSMLALEPGPTG